MNKMPTIDIHEVKAHLSRLIDEAAGGKPFVISKAGNPQVRVVPLNSLKVKATKRVGFMAGQISVPDDFNQMHSTHISESFGVT